MFRLPRIKSKLATEKLMLTLVLLVLSSKHTYRLSNECGRGLKNKYAGETLRRVLWLFSEEKNHFAQDMDSRARYHHVDALPDPVVPLNARTSTQEDCLAFLAPFIPNLDSTCHLGVHNKPTELTG